MFTRSKVVELLAFAIGALTCWLQALGAGEAAIKPRDTIVVLHDTHVQVGTEKLAPVESGIELVASGRVGFRVLS